MFGDLTVDANYDLLSQNLQGDKQRQLVKLITRRSHAARKSCARYKKALKKCLFVSKVSNNRTRNRYLWVASSSPNTVILISTCYYNSQLG